MASADNWALLQAAHAATTEFAAERAAQEALRQEVGEAEALLTQARTERKLAARELQERLEAAAVVAKDVEAVRGALATQRRDYEAAREQVRSGTLARYLEQLAEVNRLRASVGMAPLPPDPAAAALQQ